MGIAQKPAKTAGRLEPGVRDASERGGSFRVGGNLPEIDVSDGNAAQQRDDGSAELEIGAQPQRT